MFSSWTNLCCLGLRTRRKTLGAKGLLPEQPQLNSLGSQLERERSFADTSPKFVYGFKGQCSNLLRSSQTQIGSQCWSQSSLWSQQDLPPTAGCQVLYHLFVFWRLGGADLHSTETQMNVSTLVMQKTSYSVSCALNWEQFWSIL